MNAAVLALFLTTAVIGVRESKHVPMKRTYGRRADGAGTGTAPSAVPIPPNASALAAASADLLLASAGLAPPPAENGQKKARAAFTFTEVRSDSEDEGGGSGSGSAAARAATTTATLRAAGRTRALLEELAYHLVRYSWAAGVQSPAARPLTPAPTHAPPFLLPGRRVR